MRASYEQPAVFDKKGNCDILLFGVIIRERDLQLCVVGINVQIEFTDLQST